MMGPDTAGGIGSLPPHDDAMETLVLTPSDHSDPLLFPSPSPPPPPPPPPPLYPISPTSSPSSSSFLDPPSYADVVFSPFDSPNSAAGARAGDDDGGGASSLRRGGSGGCGGGGGAAEYLWIEVTDPQKEQDPAAASAASLVSGSGSTYVSYLVASAGRDGSERRVRRRFRDFVTLADRLAEAYRGFFVPPRPDKSVVESQVMQKSEFVELRRAALERYLRRLAAHPVIARSDELRVFLQAQGKLPLPATTDVASRMLDGVAKLPGQLFGEAPAGYAAAPQDVVQPAKGGRDLLRIFKELKQSVAYDWGGVKPLVVEEDKEFLERKEKILDLEQQLTTTSQQAEALVKAQQDIGETMGELGLAFIKLAKFETEEAIFDSQRARAADTKCVATAAVKASRLYRELNAQTVKHLDTLHEYLGLMLAVSNAFSDRASALLTVQTLMSDLSSLHARAEKLEAASSKIFGGDRTRLRKVEELRETIRATEDAKSCAIREYERIKENNRNELERLDRERHDDFLSMLKGFIINQVGYSEKIASVWATVADETRGYARESD
ncbi:sorting nexin 2B-like isoform X1 [Ananas comosus]|uniref:Sorting nexin 2B-like isoform X1 n=1 Tax=Ananas comosus TaxID=4615 RepID=A0A6P5EU20_ANACO|nr:sorting nexin 2B-like isoform X1 [Ananas comosus]